MKISWVAPAHNEVAITAYTIYIFDGTDFVDASAHCDGTNAIVIASTECDVAYTDLTSITYGLVPGDDIIAEVVAHNAQGPSTASLPSSTYSQVKGVPTGLVADFTGTTTKDSATVTWTNLAFGADTGFDSIVNYSIELTGGETKLSLVNTGVTFTGLTADTDYTFSITPIGQGEGTQTSTVTLRTKDIPAIMAQPVVTITGTLIKIDWTEPNLFGSTIVSYEIQVEGTSGYQTYSGCLGTDQDIVDQTYCEMEMLQFADDLGLAINTPIRAKARATSEEGQQPTFSDPSADGPIVQSKPTVAPTFSVASTEDDQLTLTWT